MGAVSTTNRYRDAEFFSRYLGGEVLDIGPGNDLICPNATGFDQQQGDANELSRYFLPESFDAVHSSHSLEHMRDPVAALHQWWPLVKPGGYLVLVVPDEDLYEQGIWPSVFNPDHKWTFRLDKADSWSPVSHEIRVLCESLPGAEVLSAEVQDFNYDHALRFPPGCPPKRKYSRGVKLLCSLAKRLPLVGPEALRRLKIHLISRGYPLDQSYFQACAQIQVVVRKRA